MKYIAIINDKQFEIDIQPDGSVLVNGEPREIDFLALGPSLYSVLMQHVSHEIVIEEQDGEYDVSMGGTLYRVQVLDERAQLLAMRRSGLAPESGEISVKAPMPGLVVAIPIEEGQTVTAGQTLLVLESMKMQNELKAPRDGTVQRISAEVGQSVEQNKLLITLT